MTTTNGRGTYPSSIARHQLDSILGGDKEIVNLFIEGEAPEVLTLESIDDFLAAVVFALSEKGGMTPAEAKKLTDGTVVAHRVRTTLFLSLRRCDEALAASDLIVRVTLASRVSPGVSLSIARHWNAELGHAVPVPPWAERPERGRRESPVLNAAQT